MVTPIPSFCRAVFSGSRDWRDEAPVVEVIESLPLDAVVIHGDGDGRGGAEGLDKMAGRLARARGLRVLAIPASWTDHAPGWCRCTAVQRATRSYCAMAGPRRNQGLIDVGKPTKGYAFPLPASRGAWDMVERLLAARIPYRAWTPEGWREQMRRPGR